MEKNIKLKQLNLPLYELVIDGSELYKVSQISLVDEPAIQSDFIFFNDETKKRTENLFHFKTANEERRLIYGAAMIADLPIFRNPNKSNPDGFYVYYSKDTVEKVAHKFLKENLMSAFNIQHSAEKNNAGVQLVESWVTKSKFSEFGMEFDAGTWIIGLYVNDDKTWNQYVKTGKVAGLSIEVFANYIPVMFSNEIHSVDLLQQITELLKSEGYIQ